MGLTNIDFVKGMPHLQILILAHNGQLQDISPISSCKELIFLELDWSAVKDFTPLVGCTSLEDLNIGLTYPSVEPQRSRFRNASRWCRKTPLYLSCS